MMKGVQKNILVFQSLSSIFKMFYENVSDLAEFFKLLSLWLFQTSRKKVAKKNLWLDFVSCSSFATRGSTG